MLLARIDGAIDVRVASRCFIAKSRALTRTGNNRCSPELFDEGRTGGRVIQCTKAGLSCLSESRQGKYS